MNIYMYLGGFVLLVGLYVVTTYNTLVILRTRIQEALSGIDVQLKRRADLIPNIVETVKGYMTHEKEVFAHVAEARSALMKAGSVHAKAQADSMVTSALKSLFAVAEAYPELKANTNFQDLQQQLEDTEDKVAYSRQFYNTNVIEYNAKIQMVPSNLIAQSLGFTVYEFFKAEEGDRQTVKVQF